MARKKTPRKTPKKTKTTNEPELTNQEELSAFLESVNQDPGALLNALVSCCLVDLWKWEVERAGEFTTCLVQLFIVHCAQNNATLTERVESGWTELLNQAGEEGIKSAA